MIVAAPLANLVIRGLGGTLIAGRAVVGSTYAG